jgi:hypothetical protein
MLVGSARASLEMSDGAFGVGHQRANMPRLLAQLAGVVRLRQLIQLAQNLPPRFQRALELHELDPDRRSERDVHLDGAERRREFDDVGHDSPVGAGGAAAHPSQPDRHRHLHVRILR